MPGQNDHAQEISVYSISERISSKLSERREVVWGDVSSQSSKVNDRRALRSPQVLSRWERWGAEGWESGSGASVFWCESVQVTGVGSYMTTEPFEAPKTHGDWGRTGKSFRGSGHPDKRPPNSPLGWVVSYSEHCCSPQET